MRKYDEEFKREAVRKIFDGQSVASVSKALSRDSFAVLSSKQANNGASRNAERDQSAEGWTAEFIRKARMIIHAKCAN